MKKISLLMTLSVIFLVGLSACGQTGPLYLPDNAPKKSSTVG